MDVCVFEVNIIEFLRRFEVWFPYLVELHVGKRFFSFKYSLNDFRLCRLLIVFQLQFDHVNFRFDDQTTGHSPFRMNWITIAFYGNAQQQNVRREAKEWKKGPSSWAKLCEWVCPRQLICRMALLGNRSRTESNTQTIGWIKIFAIINRKTFWCYTIKLCGVLSVRQTKRKYNSH